MNAICILAFNRVWHAHYTGPHAASIVSLFGTDVIPTAFTTKTPIEVVAREIARRNPDVVIL